MADAIAGNARAMSENARDAAKLIAREQQKQPGKKVRVIAINGGGFDGFKFREEGEKFIAWWPKGLRPPSWQQPVKEFEQEQAAATKAELDADGVDE